MSICVKHETSLLSIRGDEGVEKYISGHVRGMSYEQASRDGHRLCAEAAETGYWFPLPRILDALKRQMHMDDQRHRRLAEEQHPFVIGRGYL